MNDNKIHSFSVAVSYHVSMSMLTKTKKNKEKRNKNSLIFIGIPVCVSLYNEILSFYLLFLCKSCSSSLLSLYLFFIPLQILRTSWNITSIIHVYNNNIQATVYIMVAFNSSVMHARQIFNISLAKPFK